MLWLVRVRVRVSIRLYLLGNQIMKAFELVRVRVRVRVRLYLLGNQTMKAFELFDWKSLYFPLILV